MEIIYFYIGEKLEDLVAIKVHFLFIFLILPEKKFTCVENIQLFSGWVYKMLNIFQNKRNWTLGMGGLVLQYTGNQNDAKNFAISSIWKKL